MFSLDNVVLPIFLESKLQFLNLFGITFGGFVANIGGDYFTPLWFVVGFILVLGFKNSMEKMDTFKKTKYFLIINLILFIYALMMMNKVSEFLYFNF